MVEGVHSQMTEERIEKLESIGFEWALRSKWNDRFEKLKEFKTQQGHCNVPREHEPIKSLGNWVHQQRTEYKLMLEGAKSQMTEERVEKLESLGFEWRILKKRRIAHKNATVKRLSKRLRSKK
ncbi:hypothetical protein CTEN210_18471 [Chaetoceros tenuissimus]|uniref:Helicase-associated domain-containing protein n=1 Tax=Chaetoceros tenuissimus TaxID=426638 RepID=A0AAD3DEN4_9STRA|nr:hypothetical protein CTEN210_18471 [Chaetoceros tenuissimus]